jgi:hypothetical protein
MSRPPIRAVIGILLPALAALAPAQTGEPTPPAADEQQRVLRAVTDFAKGYIERLPDFTCTRQSEHFQSKTGQNWQLQAKVAEELSYYRHEEHYKIVAVNDVPASKVPLRIAGSGYYSSGGNFGHLLGELFDPRAQAQFQWNGWEELRGKRAYVFSYRVAMEHSGTGTGRCTSWFLFQKCTSVRFGYHGLLYIATEGVPGAAPPRVMRITQVADKVPAPYPPNEGSVDYDPVMVAGAEYLLPVADEARSEMGGKHFRNQSTYGTYRKFVAESTMTTAALPAQVTATKPASEANEEEPVSGHCFDLRDQAARKKMSHLAAGALAAEFNDPRKAEAELRAAMREAAEPEDADEARALLAAMYARAGQDRHALAEIDRIAPQPAGPGQDDALRDARARVATIAQFPELTVAARGISRLSYSRKGDKLTAPVTVNGKPAQFVLDTGAAISVVSEAQARALAMDLRGERFDMTDAGGQRLPCRAAVAAELAVGKFQLRNVAFCALPDDQPGFTDVPPMERGLIGLPVLLAFGTLSWTSDGVLEIGGPAAKRDLAKANLCLDGASPVLEAVVGGNRVRLALDTGNPETFLLHEFGEEFPEAVKGAPSAEEHELQGLGQSVTVESRTLPRLELRVGGQAVSLESVPMLMQAATAACLGCSGNAGLNLFVGARRVTLDFQAMRVTVAP